MSRLRCCVPFCKRTRADDGITVEIICGPHWVAIGRRYRQAYKRAQRRYHANPENKVLHRCTERLWLRCKAMAIERAAGL